MLKRKVIRAAVEALETRRLFSADLAGAFASKLPTALPVLGTNNFTLKLTNVGDATAAGNVSATLFASADQTIDEGDLQLVTGQTGVNLRAGKSGKLKLKFASPTDVNDGDYYLIARVSGDSAIGDTNAANDTVVSAGVVHISSPFVDLAAQAVTAPTKPIPVGGRAKASFTVSITNLGNVMASGRLTATVIASADPTLTVSDIQLLESAPKSYKIRPNRSVKIKVAGKLADDVPSGTFYAIGRVNVADGDPLTQSDDGNDVISSAGTITVSNPAVAAGPKVPAAPQSSVSAVIIGANTDATFRQAVVNPGTQTAVEVDEVDAGGNVIAKLADLVDDGTGNDVVAGDGVYSAGATLSYSATGTHFFRATVTDPQLPAALTTAPITVNAIVAPTTGQINADLAGYATDVQSAKNVLAGGGSVADAVGALVGTLQADTSVVPSTIVSNGEQVEWQTDLGILHTYDATFGTNPLIRGGGGADDAALPPVAPAAVSRSASASVAPLAETPLAPHVGLFGTALVLDPYNFSFSPYDESDSIAQKLTSAGYDVTLKQNKTNSSANVTVADFEDFSQYDLVAVVSHGSRLAPGSGEAIVVHDPGGQAAASRSEDLVNHRMAVTQTPDGPAVALLPSFFTVHGDRMLRTVVYFGACYSTFDTTMAEALLDKGAGAYLGYTKSVLSDFAQSAANAAVDTLLHATDNTVGDTPGLNVSVDPYQHARFTVVGDEKTRLPNTFLHQYDLLVDFIGSHASGESAVTFVGYTFNSRSTNAGIPYMTGGAIDVPVNGQSQIRDYVLVDLEKAHLVGKYNTTTTLTASARWLASDVGTITLRVALRSKVTLKIIHPVSLEVHPATGALPQPVATITVKLIGDPADPFLQFSVV